MYVDQWQLGNVQGMDPVFWILYLFLFQVPSAGPTIQWKLNSYLLNKKMNTFQMQTSHLLFKGFKETWEKLFYFMNIYLFGHTEL